MSATIPIWARVGAKVVCIKAITNMPTQLLGKVATPVPGRVYTIRDVRLDWYDTEACFHLVEIVNERVRVEDDDLWLTFNGEPRFGIRLFRPAATADDDMAAHFAHLLDAPVRLAEEA